ncbi:MAG TPA: DsbA family protein [Chitinophaga sp.]|uniref:DsbA family protein n=1 Tax=Chitinophaga sp. TaxID=1869181 RepID=UPI002CC31DA8|nr:DsbA family protein [Chitinophaga sp.]HVI48671.1 DsbA family protein [Chitinophaga sp.]
MKTNTDTQYKLVYIMDPLCGWCYGNAANIIHTYETFREHIPFEIIPGGMWAGHNARMQSLQMAAYFRNHDQQIAAMTGTAFGEAYFEFIQREDVLLNSEIPSRAIVTAQHLWPGISPEFMAAVQKARYYYGKDLNHYSTYEAILQQLNLDNDAFRQHFDSPAMKAATQAAFARAASYAMSYPTLLLETGNRTILIEQGYSSAEEIISNIASHLTDIHHFIA